MLRWNRLGHWTSHAAFAGLLLVPGAWMLHTRLEKSLPEKNSTVRESPRQIRLWFSARPEVELSKILLVGPDGTAVPVGETVATNDTLSVAAAVQAPLEPGVHTVVWRTASKDGHVVRGRFQFSFAGSAPATGAR